MQSKITVLLLSKVKTKKNIKYILTTPLLLLTIRKIKVNINWKIYIKKIKSVTLTQLRKQFHTKNSDLITDMKLPLNCEVEYINSFLELNDAKDLFIELKNIVQKTKFAPKTAGSIVYNVNFGKMMFLDQNLLDKNTFPEEHWGPTLGWTDTLKNLKEKIENFTNQKFEVCVLIFYPDGNSGVDFHSDYPAFGDTSIIPSISLGEEREFKFREKESKIEISQILENGSLTIMGKYCQDRYEHSLPINPIYKNPRINLTFRKHGYND